MLLKAATLYDAGRECGAEANTVKYLAGEAGYRACEPAVVTHGGMGYATNLIDRGRYPNAGWDGFSELWFDSVEAHDAAFASPEGKALLADAQNFAADLYGVMVVETQHIWP